jgi:hypothetical protein
MPGLFETICDVIEPLVCIGPWYDVRPTLYGRNPDIPPVWALTCHRCLHHGPPALVESGFTCAAITCEACGGPFWRASHQPTREPVARRQIVQDAAWARQLSRVYVIRDLEALKAAYRHAKAQDRERMARLMRPRTEGKTERPQPVAVGALSFPH